MYKVPSMSKKAVAAPTIFRHRALKFLFIKKLRGLLFLPPPLQRCLNTAVYLAAFF